MWKPTVLQVNTLTITDQLVKVHILLTREHLERGLRFPKSLCCSIDKDHVIVHYPDLTTAQEDLEGFVLKGAGAAALVPCTYVIHVQYYTETPSGRVYDDTVIDTTNRPLAEIYRKVLKASVDKTLNDYQPETPEERYAIESLRADGFDLTEDVIVSVFTSRRQTHHDW